MVKKTFLLITILSLIYDSLFAAEFSAAFATPWVDQDEVWFAHAEAATPFPSLSVNNIGLYRQTEDEPAASYGFTSVIAHPRPFKIAAAFLTFDLPSLNPAVAYQSDSAAAAVMSAGFEFQVGPVYLSTAFVPVYLPAFGAEFEGHTFDFVPEPGFGGSLGARYYGLTAALGAHLHSGNIRFDGVSVGFLEGDSWYAALYVPSFGIGYAHLDSSMKIRAYALVTETLGVSEILDSRIYLDAAFFWITQRFGHERVTASIDALGGLLWSRSTRLANNLTVNGVEEMYWVKADFDPEILWACRAALQYKINRHVEMSLFRLFADSLSDSAVSTSDKPDSPDDAPTKRSNGIAVNPLTLLFAGLGISVSIY